MGATAFIDHALFQAIEKELLTKEAIGRSPAIRKGMREAVNIPAKRTREKLASLLPYKGDKKGKTPLKDAVAVSVRQTNEGQIIGRVAWKRPAGMHGHLVERGHKIVAGGTLKKRKTDRRNTTRNIDRSRIGKGKTTGQVAGRFYLADSWDETTSAQMSALEAGVKAALKGS